MCMAARAHGFNCGRVAGVLLERAGRLTLSVTPDVIRGPASIFFEAPEKKKRDPGSRPG